MGKRRNAYRILVGKPEGKRPLGRPRRRCVDNIKMDLREIGWDGMDWIDMAQDRDQWSTLVRRGRWGVNLTTFSSSAEEFYFSSPVSLRDVMLN
jgi:hypothetical protein